MILRITASLIFEISKYLLLSRPPKLGYNCNFEMLLSMNYDFTSCAPIAFQRSIAAA